MVQDEIRFRIDVVCYLEGNNYHIIDIEPQLHLINDVLLLLVDLGEEF